MPANSRWDLIRRLRVNEVILMKGRSSSNRGAILKFTRRHKESSEKPGRTITTQTRIRKQHFPNTSHRCSSFNLMMLRQKNNNNNMGNTRNTHRENEHSYRNEVGKPEGKRLIGTDVNGSGPIILKLASICR